jgi:hypothetical protein
VLLLRLQEKQQRSALPRRMPCEKNTHGAGTLLPQESRTLRSNQHVNEEYHNKMIQKANNLLEKQPLKKIESLTDNDYNYNVMHIKQR